MVILQDSKTDLIVDNSKAHLVNFEYYRRLMTQ